MSDINESGNSTVRKSLRDVKISWRIKKKMQLNYKWLLPESRVGVGGGYSYFPYKPFCAI